MPVIQHQIYDMSFKHSDGDVINWEIKAYRLDGQEKSLAQFSTF